MFYVWKVRILLLNRVSSKSSHAICGTPIVNLHNTQLSYCKINLSWEARILARSNWILICEQLHSSKAMRNTWYQMRQLVNHKHKTVKKPKSMLHKTLQKHNSTQWDSGAKKTAKKFSNFLWEPNLKGQRSFVLPLRHRALIHSLSSTQS